MEHRAGIDELAQQVTVVVVPRESFSRTATCVRSVLESTDATVPLVVVDAGSSRRVASELRHMNAEHRFELLRRNHFVTPNDARNLGLELVRTPYVIFIDNDAVMAPGSIEALVECAEDTGAALVSPLYCWGEPLHSMIHTAANLVEISELNSGRQYVETHLFKNEFVDDVRSHLHRRAVDCVEFHAVLARVSVLESVGPLDPEIMGTRDHLDLSLSVAAAAGPIFTEPAARVTYVPKGPRSLADLQYHLLRWSPEWNEASLRHFGAKWSLGVDEAELTRTWLNPQRRSALGQLRQGLSWMVGGRVAGRLVNTLESIVAASARHKVRRPLTTELSRWADRSAPVHAVG